MLTREEMRQRLKSLITHEGDEPLWLVREREALSTALAAMDERSALAAEGRLLAQWLVYPPRNTSETANWNYPNISAEVERVRRLEAVLEALEEDVKECAAWCDANRGCLACYRFDTCKKRAALAAYRARGNSE